MVVTIKFVGALRSLSGKKTTTISLESPVPLKEAIKKMVGELPKLKRVLGDPELEDTMPNTLILVNRKEISVLNGLETLLKDGDEVVFVPVLHGG